jgi:hypothetical protein
MVTLGAILGVLAAGCGQSATGRATADFETSLDKLSMVEAYAAMFKDVDRPGRLAVDLRRYRLSARAYANDVGNGKASRQLADDASSIQSTCGECADWIDRIRETL